MESSNDEHKNFRLKLFCGHKGEVNSCSLSSDYQLLVTAADDAKLIIWNVAKQSMLCDLTGHTGPINCCTFSPDNKTIASASYDTTIKIWRTAMATLIKTLRGHTKSVECVCFSNDGSKLCSSSWDKLVIVWSVETGEYLHRLEGHSDCVKTCSFSKIGYLIGSGGWDNEVRVWNMEFIDQDCKKPTNISQSRYKALPSKVYVAVLKGHQGNIQTVAFSNAGLLASGSWDRTVCLWNPYRAELLKRFCGHTGWVKAVTFSIDSVELASTADDDTVCVWNTLTGERIRVYPAQTDIAQSCSFSSSGNLLTSGSAIPVVSNEEAQEDENNIA